MKIEYKSHYGPYAYRMTAEIGDSVNQATVKLCLRGVADKCYRTAGSNIDKALGVKSKKLGGMGRDGLEYDEKMIETIHAAVNAKLTEVEKEDGTESLQMSFAVTGEYVGGEKATGTKEASEVWTKLQQEKDEVKFKSILAKLGLGEDYTDETAIVAVARTLREARKAAAEAAKNALGGL